MVKSIIAIQLIINREWGLAKNENPNQGAFIIDELTDLVEEAVLKEFEAISERGGVLGAMETGYQRGKIQEESMVYEHKKHDGSYPFKSLRGICIDYDRRKQYHIRCESRIMPLRLGEAGIRHQHGKFDDDYSDVDYQMEVSLPFPYRPLTRCPCAKHFFIAQGVLHTFRDLVAMPPQRDRGYRRTRVDFLYTGSRSVGFWRIVG